MRRAQLAAYAVPGLVAAVAVPAANGMPGLGGVLAGAVLAITAGLDVLLGRRVRAWGFTERADDLLVRRGV
ncbi:MAG: PH domain-containing protein, partial [Acidimicrobiales bacterium]